MVGQVFDRIRMPALNLAAGKSITHTFSSAADSVADKTYTLVLPQNYDTDEKLYISVVTNGRLQVKYTSPTFGSNQRVLLKGTDDTSAGTHLAFWIYQGDMTEIQLIQPPTSTGGTDIDVVVFMYEIPDLSLAASYADGEIGLGVMESE